MLRSLAGYKWAQQWMASAIQINQGRLYGSARMTETTIKKRSEQVKISNSSKLLVGLVIGFTIVLAIVGLTVTSMAIQTDRQTADTSYRLAVNSTATFEAQLRRHLSEHSHQLDVAMKIDRASRLYEIAELSSLSEGIIGLHAIVSSDGVSRLDWGSGATGIPHPDLLPLGLTRSLIDRLAATDVERRSVELAYAMYEGELWLFGMTQITSRKGPGTPSEDTLPYLVLGMPVLDEIYASIPNAHLVVGEESAIHTGHDSFPLNGINGKVIAHIIWPTAHFGWTSLARTLPVIVIALVLLGISILYFYKTINRAILRVEHGLYSAQEAEKVKTDFLANTSHELRTPLNAVMGLISLLKRSKLDDDQLEMMEVIWDSANAQIALLNDLTDISKIEANTLTLNCRPFEPLHEVRSIVGLFKLQASEKEIGLNLTIPDEFTPLVLGDPKAFRQIVTNLISNAVKFTDQGKVDINVNLTCVSEVGAEFEMTVSDTGPGIPDRHKADVFKRFHRVEGGQAGTKDGSGLGLAICKALAGLMNGDIKLSREVEKGSTFTLTIPFERQTMEQAA